MFSVQAHVGIGPFELNTGVNKNTFHNTKPSKMVVRTSKTIFITYWSIFAHRKPHNSQEYDNNHIVYYDLEDFVLGSS